MVGGGGRGLQDKKNQSCSEWPESHFGFGIFLNLMNFPNFIRGHKQGSICYTMHFGSNSFEFGCLFVLLGTLKKRGKNEKKFEQKFEK